jgi:hypothetical protein
MNRTLRLLGTLVAASVALALVQQVAGRAAPADDGRLQTTDGDTVAITEAARGAGLSFRPDVARADREWILAAIARVRPEAARLIAEVDGLVRVGGAVEPGALGITRSDPTGFTIDVDLARLDNDRVMDRATVIVHEFCHVVDFALVPDAVNTTLDGLVPRGGPCGLAIDCDLLEERFADTFAKWGLRGAVSAYGAGYGTLAPASLESWGAPLASLAITVEVASR